MGRLIVVVFKKGEQDPNGLVLLLVSNQSKVTKEGKPPFRGVPKNNPTRTSLLGTKGGGVPRS